jgi:hypothetical protein
MPSGPSFSICLKKGGMACKNILQIPGRVPSEITSEFLEKKGLLGRG